MGLKCRVSSKGHGLLSWPPARGQSLSMTWNQQDPGGVIFSDVSRQHHVAFLKETEAPLRAVFQVNCHRTKGHKQHQSQWDFQSFGSPLSTHQLENSAFSSERVPAPTS